MLRGNGPTTRGKKRLYFIPHEPLADADVQDFVVDAALELGLLKLPLLPGLLRRLERWSFRSASTHRLLTCSRVSSPKRMELEKTSSRACDWHPRPGGLR